MLFDVGMTSCAQFILVWHLFFCLFVSGTGIYAYLKTSLFYQFILIRGGFSHFGA